MELRMSWAADELSGINLGDERLNKRSVKILDALGGEIRLIDQWHYLKHVMRSEPRTQRSVVSGSIPIRERTLRCVRGSVAQHSHCLHLR